MAMSFQVTFKHIMIDQSAFWLNCQHCDLLSRRKAGTAVDVSRIRHHCRMQQTWPATLTLAIQLKLRWRLQCLTLWMG